MKFSDIERPSDQKFGLFFAVIFALSGLYFFWLAASYLALVLLGLAAVFILLSFVKPGVLAPLNKGWMFIGYVLGRIVSPIVMGIIFFGLITPVSLFRFITGRDELRLKFGPSQSYWLVRDPPGPDAGSFKNQF
ncbi:SxtJ family membrane protein [Pararhizobium sp. IMCC21322]|uniref:SxtJ family membrane protein n=1 Tax=Pararhizobium sp. IMCC21322 TaxID=3067903 RepID=UPI0027429577|nr:SxtJ family membrane protein [Pararhizobium sp. IMCC21322]